jgi:large subunit ribosomal protein L10
MKKIGTVVREKIVDDIKLRAKGANACFFLRLNKIPAFTLNTVRNDLQRSGAKLFLTKNTLIKRAFSDIGQNDIDAFLGSETGVVFVHDADVVKACKTLVEFTKENQSIELRGGLLNTNKITPKDMDNLAKLPSRDVLMGMAVGAMAAPLTGFVQRMNQIVVKFLWTVEEIKKKKN